MKASFIQNPFKISNNLLFNIYFSKVNDQKTSADQKLFVLNYLTSNNE